MFAKMKTTVFLFFFCMGILIFGVLGIHATQVSAAAPVSYEAESGVNTMSGAAVVANRGDDSGGQYVGNIGNSSVNYLIFNNVSVSTTGAYTMSISYNVGGARTVYVSVNGGTGVAVSVNGASWTPQYYTTLVINLNAGNNTIKFYNNSAWAPDIDRILISPGNWGSISGASYDYTPTHTPERPYMMDYTKTLVMKMDLSLVAPGTGGEGSNVLNTYEQALDVIHKVDNLTFGAPKIVYLVGWQFSGHDSKYPSWASTNDLLKRPQDATGWDSLRWLMNAAHQYHTTVSLHINMQDAYPNSPAWATYSGSNHLISRDVNGNNIAGAVWADEQSYMVNYANEWNTGYAKSRIDDLASQLPSDIHTIHIDAFMTEHNTSPYQGITQNDQETAKRKIIRYWRDKGFDVTSESNNFGIIDRMYGLMPGQWHSILSDSELLDLPASLYGIAGDIWGTNYQDLLIGRSAPGEGQFGSYGTFVAGSGSVQTYKNEFATRFVPYYFFNGYTRNSITGSTDATKVMNYSSNVTSAVTNQRIQKNGVDLKVNDDVFMSAGWSSTKQIVIYSSNGYTNKTWTMPTDWSGITNVDIYRTDADGSRLLQVNVPITSNSLTLSWAAGQLGYIAPASGSGGGYNIALNKTVTTSSDNGNLPTSAVDGNTKTSWVAGNGSFPQSLSMDLGGTFAIKEVDQLFNETDSSTFYYKIEGSTNNSTWTTLVDRTSTGKVGPSEIETVSGSYRYIRLTVTNITNGHWASSQEFSVYGTNQAQGKTVTASSNNGNVPSNAVDGLRSTTWIAGSSSFPQWLTVDLGSTKAITHVLQFFNETDSSTFYYKIEGSTDNSTWTTLADRTANGVTGAVRDEDVTGSYRYVRLTITNITNGHWASSSEFQVY